MMNIKLLGSSGVISAAVCAVFIQYGSGSQASTLSSGTDTAPVAFEIVNVLTHFAAPAITGFLQPAGFTRPSWQQLDNPQSLKVGEATDSRFVIMLDPGHGGIDPGSKAHNGLLEKDLTLDIARRVRLFLSEFSDIEVLLTREYDHGLSRQGRVDSIRKSGADMVISLHFNHLPQTDITLVESYYAGPENIAESRAARNAEKGTPELLKTQAHGDEDLSFTQGSKRLATTLQQKVFNEVSYENDSADNAGVKQETLFVLTRSFTPGVLIELTCISNVAEAEKLNTEEYRNRLAAALADGIRTYRESIEQSPWDTSTHVGT